MNKNLYQIIEKFLKFISIHSNKKKVVSKFCEKYPIFLDFLQIYFENEPVSIKSNIIKKYMNSKDFQPQINSTSLFHIMENNTKFSVQFLANFVFTNRHYQDLIFTIMDHRLVLKFPYKILCELYPNNFWKFMSKPFLMYKNSIFNSKNWTMSPEIDGIRCIIFINVENKKVESFTSSGKKIPSLHLLEYEIKVNIHYFSQNVVFDGILQISKEEQNHFPKKSFKLERPNFFVFDMIPLHDFKGQYCPLLLESRLESLQNFFKYSHCNFLQLLPTISFCENKINLLLSKIKTKEYKGILLRENTIYCASKKNDYLKIDKFDRKESIVCRIEFGSEKILDSIIIQDNNTKVFAGFTEKERIDFFHNPQKILHKKVEIAFIGKNFEFPIFISLIK